MKRSFLLLLLLLGCPFVVLGISVGEAVVTTQVVDRTPVDHVEVYPAQMGKIYFFTRIEGATEETRIEHVWFYNDREMARVTLPVHSANWRTYSSKKMLPEWTGQWLVKIVDEAGNELAVVPFKVE